MKRPFLPSIFRSARALVVPVALVSILLGVTLAGAAKPPVQVNRSGVALSGYDAVAYFTDGAPTRGDAQFSHAWHGATWHFASAANRDTFAGEPEAYAPQYGGYCAYAVSQGSTAKIDPEAFTVYEGKLYLNYSKGVRKKWSKDIPGFIVKANANWPDVLK